MSCEFKTPTPPTLADIKTTLGDVTLPGEFSFSFALPDFSEEEIPERPAFLRVPDPPDLRKYIEELPLPAGDDFYDDFLRRVIADVKLLQRQILRKILSTYTEKFLESRSKEAQRNWSVMDGAAEYAYYTLQRSVLEDVRAAEAEIKQRILDRLDKAAKDLFSLFLREDAARIEVLQMESQINQAEREASLRRFRSLVDAALAEGRAVVAELRAKVAAAREVYMQNRKAIMEARVRFERALAEIEKADLANQEKAIAFELAAANVDLLLMMAEMELLRREIVALEGKKYAALLGVFAAEIDKARAAIELFQIPYRLAAAELAVADAKIGAQRSLSRLNAAKLSLLEQEARTEIAKLSAAENVNRSRLAVLEEKIKEYQTRIGALLGRFKAGVAHEEAAQIYDFSSYILNELLPRLRQAYIERDVLRAEHRLAMADLRVAAENWEARENYQMITTAGEKLGTNAKTREIARATIIANARVTANLIHVVGG